MLFDPKGSIDFKGNTGPFIQYTHARISAILRKAKEDGIDYSSFDHSAHLSEQELAVVILLNDFEDKIKAAGDNYAPSVIAAYVYELAKEFNRFYSSHSIFRETSLEEQKVRIALCSLVATVIKNSLEMLGIEAPERM